LKFEVSSFKFQVATSCKQQTLNLKLQGMKKHRNTRLLAILLATGFVALCAVAADFEVTGPDGRRILLKDDGTWRYVDAKGKGAARDAKDRDVKEDVAKDAKDAKDKPRDEGEAVLRLEGRTESGNTCRYDLRLVNNLPYEIRSIAPTFSAHRANGVIYDSVLAIFQTIRPGDNQRREILFRGVACSEIARLQVHGGDRCVMGELDRFTPVKGDCLSKVQVIASELVRFDK